LFEYIALGNEYKTLTT